MSRLLSSWALGLCTILLIGSSVAADLPFVFTSSDKDLSSLSPQDLDSLISDRSALAGVPAITETPEDEIIELTTTGGGRGSGVTHSISMGELRQIFDSRVEPKHDLVQMTALTLAARYPGDHTVDQVCSIYEYLKKGDEKTKGWSYVGETRGEDIYRFANFTIRVGEKAGFSGVGDCDDFAILMSSLIEAIGGTTRVVLAFNSSTKIGHAYCEVYLGRLDQADDRVQDTVAWLMEHYHTDQIFTRMESESKEAWLNLDWGPDGQGAFHPGGPFYLADRYQRLRIREGYMNLSLRPPEGYVRRIPQEVAEAQNRPPVISSLSADKAGPQEAGSTVKWTAKAEDPENDPVSFMFRLKGPSTGDVWNPVTSWSEEKSWKWETNPEDAGNYQISVLVRDEMHAGPEFAPEEKKVDFVLTAPLAPPESTYVPPVEEQQPAQTQPEAQPQETKPANLAPVMTSLISVPASPQEAGITVTWMAEASDQESDGLQFLFLLDGSPATDWQNLNQWTWTAAAEQVGSHAIEARVRDGKHNAEGDSSKSANFEIVLPPNNAPVMSSLAADKESPQVTGTAVTWTAVASDVENNPLQYRFLVNDTPATEWQLENLWTWTAGQPGTSRILVQVKDGWHEGPLGEGGNMSREFSISLPTAQSDVKSSYSGIESGPSISASEDNEIVGDIKSAIDSRVEPGNSRVLYEAVVLAAKFPGDYTINQIDSIYSYLKDGDGSKRGWQYVRDPSGIDYFSYANATLEIGEKAKSTGAGDCDDFAILIASLIETIGGTTRIILAQNSSLGGHAYAEVYLGNLDAQENQIELITNWLKQKYDTDKIYTHIDTDTNEVWLNLDWGTDEKGYAHPGGPYFLADKHIVLHSRDLYAKTPLKLPSQ